MTTEPRMFSTEQVQGMARQLISVEPMLHPVPAERVLEHLGWTVCENPGYSGLVIADPGLGVAKCLAYLHVDDDGTMKELSVSVCDNVRPRTPGSAVLTRDAFAFAARALMDVYGLPDTSEPGERPSLSWRLGDRTLFLNLGRATTRLAMRRTADHDRLVEMAANEQ